MSRSPFALNWKPRLAPLAPAAVVGTGDVAPALVRNVLAWDDADLRRLSGVTVSGMVLFIGPGETLPWIDGVSYLGRDARAPKLLLPTQREPDLPLDLVERVLVRQSPVPPPLAILDLSNRVVSVSQARALSRHVLTAWLGGKA